MLRYSSLAAKSEGFRPLTGLSIQEFEALLPSFNEAWEDFLKSTFIDGIARKRAFGGGRRPRLKSGRAKLLFILFYLRILPADLSNSGSTGLFLWVQPRAGEPVDPPVDAGLE